MKKLKKKATSWFVGHLPLLAVIIVALVVAIRNIDVGVTFSGWDNVHPELDLARYARQVVFGAWTEHQGLGAPAAQGQLAEIFRLPILFLLDVLLPQNLSRYAFIFLMYAVGGVGMYLYLTNVWLKEKTKMLQAWLASLGGIFYLLHVLTLQQFYISFEMFTVQFAFLPFLLWSIARLAQKQTAKKWLVFAGLQLLITPSGHTPTVFYLGALVSVAYAFFLLVGNNLSKAFKFALMVGAVTFGLNAYWILPNLYYSFHNSEYVQESRENQLFGPESVTAVRDAGTIGNYLASTQYLFTWKDYSFENKQFESIFNEWQAYLSQPAVRILLQSFGVVTVLGLVITMLDARKDHSRWAMVAMYGACAAMIWIDLLPTKILVEKLYESGSFLEAFRNPFTKLSIIYSVLSVLFFIRAVEWVVKKIGVKMVSAGVLAVLAATIFFTAWPTFQGHFLSEKLQITYPAQYQEMFNYLKMRDRNLRTLQLPQLGHVGWEYYDWSFVKPDNGYQGMGFYAFGMPQAFLNRDSDRWVETSDFFYHELKPALDTKNVERLKEIFKKYNVDLLIVDETKLDPNETHDFTVDHQLAIEAGFMKVWQKDFLTIYERKVADKSNEIVIPSQVRTVAADTKRVRTDVAFVNEGDYLLASEATAEVLYPFQQLSAHQWHNAEVTTDGVQVTEPILPEEYILTLPSLSGSEYFTPAAITYQDGFVEIQFPVMTLTAGQTVEMAHLPTLRFPVENAPASLVVFFNNLGVVVPEGATVSPVLRLTVGQPVSVEYAAQPSEYVVTESGNIDAAELPTTVAIVMEPDWTALTHGLTLVVSNTSSLTLDFAFPSLKPDLTRSPSENCSVPKIGNIQTERTPDGVRFQADQFGVNCNGYDFEYLSPAYSYVMHLVGENRVGRGTKFFVNYGDREIIPEDYLARGKKLDMLVTLDQLSADPTSTLRLNWETRSFGMKSENIIQNIELAPFPIKQFSQLRLERPGEPLTNTAHLVSHKTYLDAIHVVDVRCENGNCFVGLDQSFDDGWVAVGLNSGLLSHFRFNTWMNGWMVEKSGVVVILYLPELLALGCLVGVIVSVSRQVRRVQ